MKLTVQFASTLQEDDQRRLENLVEAWYGVGFEGGYEATMLHELQEVVLKPTALEVGVRVGGNCAEALRILERSLTFMHEEGWLTIASADTRERPYG